MSDLANGRASRGEQAYWWIVRGVGGVVATLALHYLSTISGTVSETAKSLHLMQGDIAVIKTELGHVKKTNEAQDTAIDDLRRRVWRMPERMPP